MNRLSVFSAAAGLAAALAGLGAADATAQTDTYRWVDQRGQVNYSDRPPPPEVRKVEERRFGSAPADTAPSYTLRTAAEEFPIDLYVADNCGQYCDTARESLTRRGVPFTEHKVDDEAELAAYRERFGQPEEVPAIAVGRQTMKGYDGARWMRMLDDAGYPKAPVR
ncbi:glutaredoxin family protein [Thauera sinica]|uniref:DUF4124 domain-containing protein n=1 Tax=Thauera sinica TaxID=2665146 RepID=A0ABW1ALZ3_9RHOO|nr:glutaredoxin family protein [Thauera sp. K11]ATE60895.1 hypothetical protein CCZ27_13945 [Thauera sp. K11]